MGINLGDKAIGGLYLGDKAVYGVYLGSVKIWPTTGNGSTAAGDVYLSARVVFLTPDKPSATVYAIKTGATNSAWVNVGVAGSEWLSGESDGAKSVTFTATSFPESGQTAAVAEITYNYAEGSSATTAVCGVMIIAAASSTVPSITTKPEESMSFPSTSYYGPDCAEFTAYAVGCGDLQAAVLAYNSALYDSEVESLYLNPSSIENTYSGAVWINRKYATKTCFYIAIYGTLGGYALLRCVASEVFVPPYPSADPEEDPGEDAVAELGGYFRFLDDSLRIDYGGCSHPVRFTIDGVPPVFMGDGDVDDATAKKDFIKSIEFSVEYEEDQPEGWLSVRTEAAGDDFNSANAAEAGSVILSRKLIFIDAERNINGEDNSAPWRKATVYARYYEEGVLVAEDSVVIEQAMLWGLVYSKASVLFQSNLCGDVFDDDSTLKEYDTAMMLVVNQRGASSLSTSYTFPPYLSGEIDGGKVLGYAPLVGTISPSGASAKDTLEFPLYGAADSSPSSQNASFFIRSYDESLGDGETIQCERGKLYYLLFQFRYDVFICDNSTGELVIKSHTVHYDRAFVPLDLVAGRETSTVVAQVGTEQTGEYTVDGITVLRGFNGIRIDCCNCIVNGVYYGTTGGTFVAGDLFVAYSPSDTSYYNSYLLIYYDPLYASTLYFEKKGIVSLLDRRTFAEVNESSGSTSYWPFETLAWIPNRHEFFETRAYLPNATDPATLPDTILAERVSPDEDVEETEPNAPTTISHGDIPFSAVGWRDAALVGKLPSWITSWGMVETWYSGAANNYAGYPFGHYNPYSELVVQLHLILFGQSVEGYSESSGENSTLITAKIYFDKELGVFDYTSVNYMLPAKEEGTE